MGKLSLSEKDLKVLDDAFINADFSDPDEPRMGLRLSDFSPDGQAGIMSHPIDHIGSIDRDLVGDIFRMFTLARQDGFGPFQPVTA